MNLTGKRHLLITGGRGTGKTTLLNALAEPQMPGLITRAVPGKMVVMTDRLTGETFPIGEFDPASAGTENRMVPLRENLEARAAEKLRRFRDESSPWVVLDEIGYLESGCPAYGRALDGLMEEKRLLAAVRKQEIPFLQSILNRQDACLVDLDAPFGQYGCVILASGLGRRFGSNKLLADFGGRPLICAVLDATEGIFEKRVVVTRHGEVAELCRQRRIPAVLHDLPYRSDTVRLGLDALGPDLDGWVFCPADQPLLTRETMELLALCGSSGKICRLSWEGRGSTPVLFPKWCREELRSLPEGKGGSVLVKKYPEQVLQVPVQEEYELLDVDTPEDLEKLLAF